MSKKPAPNQDEPSKLPPYPIRTESLPAEIQRFLWDRNSIVHVAAFFGGSYAAHMIGKQMQAEIETGLRPSIFEKLQDAIWDIGMAAKEEQERQVSNQPAPFTAGDKVRVRTGSSDRGLRGVLCVESVEWIDDAPRSGAWVVRIVGKRGANKAVPYYNAGLFELLRSA